MVEVTETEIKLKMNHIDNFLLRLKAFMVDAFRDAKDQLDIPFDDREIEFEYRIKS